MDSRKCSLHGWFVLYLGGLAAKWIVGLLVLMASFSLAAEERGWAFVSLADENRVAVYSVIADPIPRLTLVSFCSVSGDAGSQFFDQSRSVLYLGLRNAGEIVALKFHREKGVLTAIDQMKVDRDPAYLRLDGSQNWLLAAYYATGRVSCCGIDQEGRFDRKSLSWVSTARCAHAIICDRSNRFLFVPHTGPNSIFQFRFDSKTGKLSGNEPARLSFPSNTGPRHIVAHPTETDVFFVLNEQASSLTHLQMNRKTGLLNSIRSVSTLPGDFAGNNSCSDLEISKDGRFLYGANRGHDSIAVFEYSMQTGLKRTGLFPTEKTPRQFALSTKGEYLIAAGQGSNQLAVYQVKASNGFLKRTGTIPTGRKPWWVSIVD